MGKTTGIQWCDATVNPWMGCHKVSSGCRECYMFREQEHYGHDPNIVRRSKTTFNDPLKWKEPKRIFVCSWSDFFIEEADEWRADFYDVMREAYWHTYLLLTKRVENIPDRLPIDWGMGWDNVILMITAENQEMLEKRMWPFLDIPAKNRGISVEPILGPVVIGDIPIQYFD